VENVTIEEYLSRRGLRIYEDLASGDLKSKGFQNKKIYAKTTNNLNLYFDLCTAWCVFKYLNRSSENG